MQHGAHLYGQLYEHARLVNNTPANLVAIFRTLAVLSLEVGAENAMVDMMRMMFSLQVSQWR